MIGSLIFSVLYLSNGFYKTNIVRTILTIILVISFLVCLIYLIGEATNNSSIKNKFKVIGDNSGVCCIGIIIVFIIFVGIGNMFQGDLTNMEGHVELDNAQFNWLGNGGKTETGYWVYESTGTPTGEKEYDYYGAKISQNISFNIKNIKWDSQIDEAKLNQALKPDNIGNIDGKTIVTLYDKDGNYLNKYETVAKLVGDKVIISSDKNDSSSDDGFSFDKDEMNSTDIKYLEVEIILKNDNATQNSPDYYSFDIKSDRYKLS